MNQSSIYKNKSIALGVFSLTENTPVLFAYGE